LELYLLRHGEAGKRLPVAARDSERDLTEAGKGEMKEVGEGMVSLGVEFDIVASSPLRRAKETAIIVNRALKRKDQVEEWTELSPEGSREALYRRLARQRAGSSVLCVGHEPYLTTAIGELAARGQGEGVRILLKKGGLARLTLAGGSKPTGVLRWLLTPRQLRKMA
jgi:phosphohistidine phosphatase